MGIRKRYVQQFFILLTSLSMIWAITTSIISPRIGAIFSLFRDTYSYKITIIVNVICLIFSLVLYLGVFFLLKKLKGQELNNKVTYVVLLFELLIYFIAVLLFVKYIGFSNPVDGTRITLRNLQDLQAGKEWGYNYMYSNPQNLLLMYLFWGIQQLFGTSYQAIIVVFTIMHLFTILLLFLSLKNLKISNLSSLIAVQVMIFAIQIAFHVPVAYTDILSLFFTALTFYFMTNYLAVPQEKMGIKLLFLSLALVACTIGFISKGTVLILVIAIALFLGIVNQKQWKLLCLFPFIFLFLGNFGWKQVINSQELFPDTNYGQPNTHYLMMGLNSTPIPDDLPEDQHYRWMVGAYSSSDQEFTWSMFLKEKLPKKEVEEKNLQVVKERLSNLSMLQILQVLNNKVSVSWSSGDLKSSFEVFLGTGRDESKMHLFKSKSTGLILYSVMMTIQYIVYLGIILAGIKFFKKENDFILLCTIYISGYFAFLLIWEASPRYAMGIFIPAILMIGLLLERKQLTK